MKKIIALAVVGTIAVSCGGNVETDIQEQVNDIEEKVEEVVESTPQKSESTDASIETSYLHFKIDGEDENIDQLLAKKSIVQVMDDIITITGRNSDESKMYNISFSGADMANPVGVEFTGLLINGKNTAQLTYATGDKSYMFASGKFNITKLDFENEIIEGTVSGNVAEVANMSKPELHKSIEGDFHMEGVKFKDLRSK